MQQKEARTPRRGARAFTMQEDSINGVVSTGLEGDVADAILRGVDAAAAFTKITIRDAFESEFLAEVRVCQYLGVLDFVKLDPDVVADRTPVIHADPLEQRRAPAGARRPPARTQECGTERDFLSFEWCEPLAIARVLGVAFGIAGMVMKIVRRFDEALHDRKELRRICCK